MPRFYQFGMFLLDKEGFELRRKGQPLPLSASLFKLLTLFVEHPNELLTRERIAACLWEEPQFVDTATGINTAISRLRMVLGESSSRTPFLQTVVGKGYRFVAEVQQMPDSPKAPQSRADGLVISTTLHTLESNPPHAARQGGSTLQRPVAQQATESGPVASGRLSLDGDEAKQVAAPSQQLAASFGLPQQRASSAKARLPVPWRRWLFAGLAFLLVAAFLVSRRIEKAATPFQSALDKISFVEVTYNRETLPVLSESLSPDNRYLAYTDATGLHLKELSSSLVRTLLPVDTLRVSRIVWTPDSRRILAHGAPASAPAQQPSGLWEVSLSSGETHLLIHDSVAAAVSPDGQHLASIGTTRNEILITDAQGRNARQLHRKTAGVFLSLPMWSPSGESVLFQACSRPDIDPSVNGLQGQICEIQAVNATNGRLLFSQSQARITSAVLPANGVLYLARDLPDEWSRAALFAVRVDHRTGQFLSAPETLEKLPGDSVLSLSANREGNLFAALIRRRSSEVFVGTLKFPGPRLVAVRRLPHVAPQSFPHSWSDRHTVLTESDDDGQFSLFKQPADGSPAQLFARAPDSAIFPQLSPDSRWVLFENVRWFAGAHVDGLFRVPAEGGAIQQLATQGEIQDFRCPVGDQRQNVACVVRQRSGNAATYHVLDPEHGEGREILRLPLAGELIGDWSVSPDGSTIAIAKHDPEHPALELHAIGRPEQRPRLLPIELPEPGTLLTTGWDPLGRGFLAQVRTGVGYDLLFIDRAGKAVLLRRTFAPTWGVPSADGSSVAFVDETPFTNVWIGAPGVETSAAEPANHVRLQTMLARHP